MKKHQLVKSLLFAPLLALVVSPILMITEPNSIFAEADSKTNLEKVTEKAEKSSKAEKNSDKDLSSGYYVEPSVELNPSLSIECTSGGNCPSTSTNTSELLDLTIHRNGNSTIADGEEWYLIPIVSDEEDFYLSTHDVPETHFELYSPSYVKMLYSRNFDLNSLTTFSFTSSDSSIDVTVNVELYNNGNNYIAFYISDNPFFPEYDGYAGTTGSSVSLGSDYNTGPYNAINDNLFVKTIDNQDPKDRFEILNSGYGTIKDESPSITSRTICNAEDVYCEYVANESLAERTFTYTPEPGHTFDQWSSGEYYADTLDTETSTTYTLTTTSDSPLIVLTDTILNTNPVYRFWSDQNNMHFYTISQYEKNYVIDNYTDYQWKYERIAYYAAPLLNDGSCPAGSTSLYRFWSDQNDGHFYTTSEYEKNYVIDNYTDYQWKYERVAYCVGTAYPSTLQDAVYRFWSDQNHGHFYTSSNYEKDYVIDNYTDYQWRYERIAFYVSNSPTQ